MIQVEIRAIIGNLYNPATLKYYKRNFYARQVERTYNNEYKLVLDELEDSRLMDFFNRMGNLGSPDSYYFHLIATDKWFESRIIDMTAKGIYLCNIFDEGKFPYANFIEI